MISKTLLDRIRQGIMLPGLLALLFVFGLQLAGFRPLQNLGLQFFDAYVRAEPREYTPVPIKIVDIDEESLRRQGQWPWPRTEVGRLLGRIGEAGAAAIALDIVFAEPDRTSPPRIAEQLRKSGVAPGMVSALQAMPDNDAQFAADVAALPVVTGLFLTHAKLNSQAEPKAGIAISGSAPEGALASYTDAIQSLPAIRQAAAGSGFLTIAGDSDGIIRKAPLLAEQNGQIMPALSLEALRVAQGAGSIIVKTSDGSGNMAAGTEGDVTSIKVGDFEVPTTRAGELWMYYTQPQQGRTVPAWKILSGTLTPEQMEQEFAGAIVFVGTGAIGLRDLIATPLQDRELGVMVHAQAVEQMILGAFLTRPDWADGLERMLVLVFGLILLIFLPRLGAAKGAALGVLMVATVLAGSWWAFHAYRFLLEPTYPLLAVLAVYITITVLTYYREEKQRSYIRRAFDRYLSPELVKRIAADPHQLELGGEERQMTVLFCDVRGFSRISEQLAPKQIISFLIGFLTPMCEILLGRKATIDKFIGDAILAFWNAPLEDQDQYANAARSALGMQAKLAELNESMPKQTAQPWPGPVAIGIGLNAGPCCVGNMGSSQRLSYSLIGDTVNLASRIEGLTKYYGVGIAMGEDLQRELTGFASIPLDLVRVVGRSQPEQVYALIGDETVAADQDFIAFAALHEQMLAAYRAQDWKRARSLLDEGAQGASKFGLSKLYGLYGGRIAALEDDPPPGDWDGVFTATEK